MNSTEISERFKVLSIMERHRLIEKFPACLRGLIRTLFLRAPTLPKPANDNHGDAM